MEPIRVVWGTGTGPTALSAYDSALAAANVHEYNLVRLSSVVPQGARIETPGTAPSLGPVGGELRAVEAAATTDSGSVSAALGWARREDGSGIFYEAAAADGVDSVVARVRRGLSAGADLRDGRFGDPSIRQATATADGGGEYAAAAVLAVYGSASSLL